MAAKTPVTTRSTSGYVDPGRGFYGGVNALNAGLLTNGTHYPGREGLRLQIFYFADIDAADTWSSGIKDIRALAWQAEQADSDAVGVTLISQSLGLVALQAENADSSGWLWVLSGGSS